MGSSCFILSYWRRHTKRCCLYHPVNQHNFEAGRKKLPLYLEQAKIFLITEVCIRNPCMWVMSGLLAVATECSRILSGWTFNIARGDLIFLDKILCKSKIDLWSRYCKMNCLVNILGKSLENYFLLEKKLIITIFLYLWYMLVTTLQNKPACICHARCWMFILPLWCFPSHVIQGLIHLLWQHGAGKDSLATSIGYFKQCKKSPHHSTA